MNRKLIPTAFLTTLFLACAVSVFAHLPRIADPEKETQVKNPEFSQAFYGELKGEKDLYVIESDRFFRMYASLSIPDIEGSKENFSALISKEGQIIAKLDGVDFVWLNFYEPFGDDFYLQGPVYEADADPGSYEIEVFNADNSGKYVLAIGKKEHFTFFETLNTLKVLPALKKEFWGKPWWKGYMNYFGLMAFIIVTLFCIVMFLAIRFYQGRVAKKILDDEYEKYGSSGGKTGSRFPKEEGL